MTYDKTIFENQGIKVSDFPFPDGTIPPQNVISGFLGLCDERFPGGIAYASSCSSSNSETDPSGPAIVCDVYLNFLGLICFFSSLLFFLSLSGGALCCWVR